MHSQVSERRFDLSRDTFRAANRYRSIVRQQGRVTVDADDNEQRRIELHRSDLTTLDVIGPCGYPEGGTGFLIGVAAGNQSLTVGLGRMYVDGLLAENFTTAPQLLLDSSTAGSPPSWLGVSASGAYEGLASGTYLIYLDVWERDVTALDDPNIRETALGGPDTAARTQLVAQVHLTPVASGTTCASASLPVLPAHTGTLEAGTDPAAAAGDCSLPPLAGFRGQENQLYRVEIQVGGAPGSATFKWSRENGSVVTAITGPSSGSVGQSFTVQNISSDSTLGFAANQWVELLDDDLVLTGQPGYLALLQSVDPSLTVTLTPSSPSGVIAYGNNPKIRRWEQTDPTASSGVLTSTTPIDLENGVQVSFGGAMLYAGDYWTIPARTAINEETGTLDYPSTPQTASYTEHHLASLAVVTYDATAGFGAPSDCRIPFPPLTGLPKGGGCCCTTVTVGDGKTSTGQYSDIGAAIASLGSAGGVVGVEAGSYTISTPIVVPDSVIVRGCRGRTLIDAENGAFIVNGDDVTIEGLSIRIGTAAAVATVAGNTVNALALRDNDVRTLFEEQESAGGAEVAYGFSFSANGASVTANTLLACGIEVQPSSTNVTIGENEIKRATARGISLGSQTAAAPPPDSDSGVYLKHFDYSTVNSDQAVTLEANIALATLATLDIFGNTILAAALEGIAAETIVANAAGNQRLLLCSDVTIADNLISGCLANPEPAKVVASGAILIPLVEGLRVLRNTIAENGPTIPASGICALAAAGSEIRENRILQNGSGGAAEANYGMAAIELYLAFSGNPFPASGGLDIGLAAATVSDNVVTSANALALYMMADGQVSVTKNDFTAVGFCESQLAVGQCVTILDLGTATQETVASTPTFTTVGFLPGTQTYSSDDDVTGGQVLFTGNRCLYDGRNTGELVRSSIAIASTDNVLFDGNQSRAFVRASSQAGSAGVLITNLLVEAAIAQASGNRLSEDEAFASALVIGGDTIGIGNHGTHCLYFQAAGALVESLNITNPLNSEGCQDVGTRLFGQ